MMGLRMDLSAGLRRRLHEAWIILPGFFSSHRGDAVESLDAVGGRRRQATESKGRRCALRSAGLRRQLRVPDFPAGSRRREAADLRRLTKILTGSHRGDAVDSEPRAWIHPPAYAGGYGFRISLPR